MGGGLVEALKWDMFKLLLAGTAPGRVWMARTGMLAGLVVVLQGPRFTGKRVLEAVLAGGVLGSLAWLGHAGAGLDGRGAWMVGVDVAHLLAAGVWPGGSCLWRCYCGDT